MINPLESLERWVHSSESQVFFDIELNLRILLLFKKNDRRSMLNENPMITNLLSNNLKRSSSTEDFIPSKKKSRINPEDSTVNTHRSITNLLTKPVNDSSTTFPLPSITSLRQKPQVLF